MLQTISWPIKELILRHKKFWTRERAREFLKAFLLFLLALVIQEYADRYVGRLTGIPVGDLILSHIPTFNIDIFVVQGALLLTFAILAILAWKPRYLIFTTASIAVFVIVRAFFISLTHLGIDPHQIVLDTTKFGFSLYDILYNAKGDFFFSGHTGAPFLMGLIFMRNKFLSVFFFSVSFIFAVSVLLGHIHYSIDVFAAPFMTYGIFTICKKLFAREYALIRPERRHDD